MPDIDLAKYDAKPNDDGTITLTPIVKKFSVEPWSVAKPRTEAFHVHGCEVPHFYGSTICLGCFPDAEARARRLAAELNGEIKSAETILRRVRATPNLYDLADDADAYLKAGYPNA